MKQKPGFSEAYSLVELAIAMAIAAIMFMGIYLVSIQTMRILQMSRDETRAVQAAQYEIEKLRSYSWSVIDALPEDSVFDDGDNAILGQLNNASGAIKKTLHPEASIAEPIYAITVTIHWDGPNGDPVSKSVTTLITETGILR